MKFCDYVLFREMNWPEPSHRDWSSLMARSDDVEERGGQREQVLEYLSHIGKVLDGFCEQMKKFGLRMPNGYVPVIPELDFNEPDGFISHLYVFADSLERLNKPELKYSVPHETIIKGILPRWNKILEELERLLGDIENIDFTDWAAEYLSPKHLQFIMNWIVRLREFLIKMESPLKRLLFYVKPIRNVPKWMEDPRMAKVKNVYRRLD